MNHTSGHLSNESCNPIYGNYSCSRLRNLHIRAHAAHFVQNFSPFGRKTLNELSDAFNSCSGQADGNTFCAKPRSDPSATFMQQWPPNDTQLFLTDPSNGHQIEPCHNELLDVRYKMTYRIPCMHITSSLKGLLLSWFRYSVLSILEKRRSINQLVDMHVKLGALILFGLLYTLAGLAALRSLKVRSTFLLGLQIFALLILTVVVVATLYGVATQWIATMPIGVSFSVQEFNPGDPKNMAMANIQNVLKCCGRECLEPGNITNERFSRVPGLSGKSNIVSGVLNFSIKPKENKTKVERLSLTD
ncbi:hypothetical protein CLF_107265 [Clonorchis sinensis]|uniref:Uncharacterized protein n=1 Tax=Clonorchis sinensis TaxID=79923 RepID=G7YGG5_CLOSI|nr:hypothetical protein CLF_107265 [Clonorchis sinensis]